MPRKRSTCIDCGASISGGCTRCRSCFIAARSTGFPKHDTFERTCRECGRTFPAAGHVIQRGGGNLCSFACRGRARRVDSVTRFWGYVRKTDACWLWTGPCSKRGYGQIRVDTKLAPAHRFAYELLVGPIPEGTEIDHVRDRGCRHRNCVNPAHLEPVPHRVNVLRGDSPAASYAQRTHCAHGHEFTEENTYHPPRGGRVCRTCRRVIDRARAGRRR